VQLAVLQSPSRGGQIRCPTRSLESRIRERLTIDKFFTIYGVFVRPPSNLFFTLMSEVAMHKKVLPGFAAVFVVLEVTNFVFNGLILGPTYQSLQNLWRPDMMSFMWIYHVIMLIGAFFFSFIFSKGYERKGIAEGVRYGLYIGIWLSIGMAYGTYAMIQIPYSLALQWFIYGVIQYLVAGIVLALVFKERPKPAA